MNVFLNSTSSKIYYWLQVHYSITGGLPLLGTTVNATTATYQSPQSAFQRHNRAPYFKQGNSTAPGERRSSWASSSTGSAVLAINAQQQAQLERLYRQSIGQTSAGNASGVVNSADAMNTAQLSGIQQLHLEFQKLCADTKNNSSITSNKQQPTTGAAPIGMVNPNYRCLF